MIIKEFKSSKINIIYSIVGFTALLLLFTFSFIVLLILILKLFDDIKLVFTIWISIVIIVTIINIFRVIKFQNIKVVIDKENVIFKRYGIEYLKFEKAKNVFSSYTVTHSINYIPTSTERFLIVINENEEKKIKCYNFSKKSFNDFIAIITYGETNDIIQKNYEVNEESHIFLLPKKEAVKFLKLSIYILLVLGIICTLYLIFVIVLNTLYLSEIILMSLGAVFVGMSIPIVASVSALSKINFLKNGGMPEKIEITSNYILLDNKKINYNIIDKFIMPSLLEYPNFKHYKVMEIHYLDGKKEKYIMGRIDGKAEFKEYPYLCETLYKYVSIKFI